jgi:hypothetical protein
MTIHFRHFPLPLFALCIASEKYAPCHGIECLISLKILYQFFIPKKNASVLKASSHCLVCKFPVASMLQADDLNGTEPRLHSAGVPTYRRVYACGLYGILLCVSCVKPVTCEYNARVFRPMFFFNVSTLCALCTMPVT